MAKITLGQLEIIDFTCIEHAIIDFAADSSTFFNGENGSGKSSVLEGLGLCFGERKRGETYRDFVRSGAKKAELHFKGAINAEPIAIDIAISESSSTVDRHIEYQGKPYSNSECITLLTELEVVYFSQVIFFLQDEGDVTKMSPGELSAALQRLLEFDMSVYLGKIKERVTPLSDAITAHASKIDALKGLTYPRSTMVSQKLTPEELNQHKGTITSLEAEKQKVVDEIFQAQENNSSRSKTLIDKSNLEGEISKIESEITTLQSQKATSVASRQAKMDAYTKALSDEKTRITNLENALKVEEGNLPGFQQQVENAKVLLASAREKADLAEKSIADITEALRIATLADEGLCTHCGQETKHLLNQESDTYGFSKMSASERQSKLVIAKRGLAAAKLQIDQATRDESAAATQVTATVERIKAMKDALKTVAVINPPDTQALDADIKQKSDAVTDKEKILVSKKGDLAVILTKVASLPQEITIDRTRLEGIETQLTALRNDVDEYGRTSERNNQILLQNQKAEKDEQARDGQVATLTAEIAKFTTDLNVLKEVKEVLERDLPNYLVVKTCARLEVLINEFVQNLFPEMVIELKQNKKGVNFFYTPASTGKQHVAKKKVTAKMASGMERQVLSLAWRVALAHAYGINLLLLDEIDAAASDNNSEKLFNVLFSDVSFDQVIVISHKLAVRKMLESCFDNIQAYYVDKGVFGTTEPEEEVE